MICAHVLLMPWLGPDTAKVFDCGGNGWRHWCLGETARKTSAKLRRVAYE